MNKILLESSHISKFDILQEKPANVLKRLKMKLADWNQNRNGRIYPKQLWINAVNSDYTKEMINTHTLYGEADHPEERMEISLKEVSHAVNDMWIENDGVWGIIDILPTPKGQIVNQLIDYGSEIGISSRGSGSVMSNGQVDPDDYTFVTFDLVTRPSVAAARLDHALIESVDVSKEESVKNILNEYSSLNFNKNLDEKCKNFIYLDEEVKEALLDSSIDDLTEAMK